MTDTRPILLLTRPEAQSRRMASEAAALGDRLAIVVAPLARIVDVPPDGPLPNASALIATSENAIAAAVRQGVPVAGRDIWCVGARTAAASSDAGAVPLTGQGGAAALAARIIAATPTPPLLWLRGADVAVDIAEQLKKAGIDTISRVIYRVEPLSFSPQVQDRLGGADALILPLLSQGSSARLAQALAGTKAKLTLVAISETVADGWAGPAPDRTIVVPTHDSRAIIGAIRDLLG